MREMDQARSEPLFASPLLSHLWDDAAAINPALRDSILEQSRLHSGAALTNFGGWHSEPGILKACGEAGAQLTLHIHAMIEEATARLYAEFGRPPPPTNWALTAWANVNRHGDFNLMHTHPGATWSGVYYVDDGESNPEAEGTALQLFDPNPARTNIFFPELSASNLSFKPLPGLMVLFPSYVPHAVPPHQGESARISVAFNVRRDPFP